MGKDGTHSVLREKCLGWEMFLGEFIKKRKYNTMIKNINGDQRNENMLWGNIKW
jgi:hypothetical protein